MMREGIPRARWALEPALAVGFLAVCALAALLPQGAVDPGSALLLAVAIAASRVSPGGAVTAGWFAVVLHVAALVRGEEPSGWGLVVAGAVTVFGTAAYGTRAIRGWGLAVVVVLSGTCALLGIRSVFTAVGSGLPTPAALVLFTAAYLVIGTLSAALLTGGWLLGLTLHRRAGGPARRAPFETWLMQAAGASADPVARVGGRRLTDDAIVAVVFFVVAWLAGVPASVADVAVLVLFAAVIAFRRYAPPIALALAWIGAIVQMASGAAPGFVDVAVLAALFAASAYGERVTRLTGLASVPVGAVTATGYLFVRTHPGAPLTLDAAAWGSLAVLLVASVAVLGLAWTLGLLLRTWRTARQSRRQELRTLEEHRQAQRAVVVEQERSRIARDMHDVVAHSLAVVIAQADGARYARATDAGAVDSALVTISATARAALADVRVLLAQLRQDDGAGPQPTLDDLAPLAAQMRDAGLALTWTETGAALPLGSGAQLAVYRIVQEALTNALRHGAPGGDVQVTLDWSDTGLALEIGNDLGTEREEARGDTGHGLPGMRERAVLAGGSLHAQAEGDRFLVRVHIPAGQAAPLAGEPA
jgi:signal transduction histidine kinase